MADTFGSTGVVNQSDPAYGAIAFTGAATVEYAKRIRGVYVAVAGNLECVMADGNTVTFVGLLAGSVYPFCLTSIVDAGTTCSGHVLI